MRNNQPCSGQEYPLQAQETLVSLTDVQGRIVYCNQAFIVASGFTSEELLGQPHNLVRHPDMPAEAFRDLWATVQRGVPWRGLVKNRRKDGDHYWVQASVTPVRSGDVTTGYLSVRTVPSRQQVQAAEALYVGMRNAQAQGRLAARLDAGQLAPAHRVGRLGRALRQQLTRWHLAGAGGLASAVATGAVAANAPLGVWLPLAFVLAAAAWGGAWWQSERRLHQVARDALTLASGNLSHPVSTDAQDALGLLQRALAQLGVNLRATIADVRAQVDQVRTTTDDIAASNRQLAQRNEEQAASLRQTSAAMAAMADTVQATAEQAHQGTGLARDMDGVAARSQQAVQDTVTAMDGINRSSLRIGDVLQVIEAVALRTNLLALNAAVEAARAGDAGRGFAVVAAEVRGLSQRTSESAREVRQLIAESAERVSDGVHHTDHARQSMAAVLAQVDQVEAMMGTIHQAARAQMGGIDEIGLAVRQLDSLAQENSHMVDAVNQASQGLHAQVERVGQAMQLFRLAPGDRLLCETAQAVDLRKAQSQRRVQRV
jgi:aerotaxis receptor